MMNVVSAVIVLVFAVIGAVAVCREISLRLFSAHSDCTVMYIANIKADEETLEFALRGALNKQRWAINRKAVGAVCLNCELTDNTRKICERVCKEYGFSKLMTKDEFLKSLDN